MRILFISRAYPPTVGGIENQNYELSVWLAKIADVKTIANRKGKKFLPFFMPYALVKSLFLISKFDAVLLGDGVLTGIGWILKALSRKPVISVVHGLDLTFKSKIYQMFWVGFFIKKMDKLIAVGNETIKVAMEKGIAKEKLIFIPNGIDTKKYLGEFSKTDLKKALGQNIADKKIILTSGRLAKRKGVAWFIRNVMPKLDNNILYVVAGNGPDKDNIKKSIAETNMPKRVIPLGYITDPVRDMLFHTCDVFVQPNIKIHGDMEGFGISVIEAAYCGIPVIASRLEGLQDAIQDNQNGFLIESEDADGYVSKINELLSDDNYRKDFGKRASQYVIDNFSWEKVSKKYLEEIEKTVSESKLPVSKEAKSNA